MTLRGTNFPEIIINLQDKTARIDREASHSEMVCIGLFFRYSGIGTVSIIQPSIKLTKRLDSHEMATKDAASHNNVLFFSDAEGPGMPCQYRLGERAISTGTAETILPLGSTRNLTGALTYKPSWWRKWLGIPKYFTLYYTVAKGSAQIYEKIVY